MQFPPNLPSLHAKFYKFFPIRRARPPIPKLLKRNTGLSKSESFFFKDLKGMWSIRILDDLALVNSDLNFLGPSQFGPSPMVNSDPDHWSIQTFFHWPHRVTCPWVLKKPKFELVCVIAHLVLIISLWNWQAWNMRWVWKWATLHKSPFLAHLSL